jgi:hypothetical protein
MNTDAFFAATAALGLSPTLIIDSGAATISPSTGADDFLRAVLAGTAEPTRAGACKWECRRRILERFSETDQTNAQRRATVLLRRLATGTITPEELAEGDQLEAADAWINAHIAHAATLAKGKKSPFASNAGWPTS